MSLIIAQRSGTSRGVQTVRSARPYLRLDAVATNKTPWPRQVNRAGKTRIK